MGSLAGNTRTGYIRMAIRLIIWMCFMFAIVVPDVVRDLLAGSVSIGIVYCVRQAVLMVGVEAQQHGSLLTGEGFSILVDWKCTGILYILALAAGLFSFPATWRSRIAGYGVGFVILSTANIIRITTIFLAGIHSPEVAIVLHDVVWEGIMIVVTFLCWVYWMKWAKRRCLPGNHQHPSFVHVGNDILPGECMRHLREPLKLVLAGLLLTLTSCRMTGGPVGLVDAFPHLSFMKPVFLTHPGDGTNRLFVVQQNGLIMVFDNHPATTLTSVFLNVSGKLSSAGGEEGLLGLAFHPQYASNGIFFINYTVPDPLRTIVARYHVSASNPSAADTTGEVILEVDQPYSNHNGGMLAFGPDGYLYIGLGDGGSGGDPHNNGQSLSTLLGKILRIDVNSQSQNLKYAIPPDNPLVGNLRGFREEIWAYGLRNPWRFSFDRESGQLWAGDVGQGSREEVDLIEKGKNYGWRIMEGFACYSPSSGCDQTGLTLPLVEYSHSEGISITGGYVYRGTRSPDIEGKYIFGDYGSRRIWALQTEGGKVTSDSLLFLAPALISSFGEDKAGELYVVTYSSGASTHIYVFDQSPATSVQEEQQRPESMRLDQNYPNPFNPTTRIGYSVGRVVALSGTEGPASTVRLAVYDLLGREVAVLVNGMVEPGSHEVAFDGSGLSSGLYFCRLQAGGFMQTRKMVLLP